MNFPEPIGACGDEVVGPRGDDDGNGIWFGGSTSLARGEFAAVGRGVAIGVLCGAGVTLGISNRPRRCDAVGEIAGDEIGVEVIAAVATGVAVGGTGADAVAPDVADVCVLAVVSAFTNCFGGAFGGGVASDFIFWRVFCASS